MGFQKVEINSQLNNKMLKYGSVALLAFSAFDAVLTLIGLSIGKVEEVNPLMRWLIAQSPLAFMAFKLALPAILCFIVWWAEEEVKQSNCPSLGGCFGGVCVSDGESCLVDISLWQLTPSICPIV